MIADDFLIGVATISLNYRLDRTKEGRPQAGFCISGQTIAGATKRILEQFDKDMKGTVIIYLGSMDVIIGRELVEMMSDFNFLISACIKMNKKPIICTLAPIPTHQLQNRKEILEGFNEFLRNNPYGIPVININKVFVRNDVSDEDCYQEKHQFISGGGTKTIITFWSREGRDRFYRMILKNLGFAYNCNETKIFEFM